jgi:hypothetical protein
MHPPAGRRLKGSGLAFLGLCLALAACGSPAASGKHPPGKQAHGAAKGEAALTAVMRKALADVRAEPSFHYTSAEFVSVTKDGPEHVASSGDVGRTEGRETIGWKAGAHTGQATVELVGGVVYLRSASASMLHLYFGLPQATATADAGRWLSASPKQDASGFAALSAGLTVKAVIDRLGIGGPYAGKGVTSGVRKVRGSISGIGSTRIPAVFSVRLAGRPLLVGGTVNIDRGQGKSSFSWSIGHFGEKFTVSRPH